MSSRRSPSRCGAGDAGQQAPQGGQRGDGALLVIDHAPPGREHHDRGYGADATERIPGAMASISMILQSATVQSMIGNVRPVR
jgi:hypothetical protein